MKPNILITGGSGMIGQRITHLLEDQGYEVAWLSRSEREQKSFLWDIDKSTLDPKAIDWADVIIHLAGTGVADKRWTEERKALILNSRVNSTRLLYDAVEKSTNRPSTIISASAVGYYGFDTGTNLMTEGQAPGNDFLAGVVAAWEDEVKRFENLALRTVMLRIGIVLDANGGALGEMMKPPITAPLGTGDQWMSWIALHDLARTFVFAVEKTNLQGVYNAVAPNPVTNYRLTKDAAQEKGKLFIGIGVPGFLLKLVLGEMSAMVLGGNRVSSQKIQKAGFEFDYEELEPALKETYK